MPSSMRYASVVGPEAEVEMAAAASPVQVASAPRTTQVSSSFIRDGHLPSSLSRVRAQQQVVSVEDVVSSSSVVSDLDAPKRHLGAAATPSAFAANVVVQPDENRTLTVMPSPSYRESSAPIGPPPLPPSTPEAAFAIPGPLNLYRSNIRRDVHPQPLNASRPSAANPTTPYNQNVHHLRPHTQTPSEGSLSTSIYDGPLNGNSDGQLRSNSSPVFTSSTDLAAHYGIPQLLPPAPRLPVQNNITEEQHSSVASAPSSSDSPTFADLCSNYIAMLAQNSAEHREEVTAVAAPDTSMSVAHAVNDSTTQALMEIIQGESYTGIFATEYMTHLCGLRFPCTASPEFQQLPSPTDDDMFAYLTSPMDDSPLDDFLTTPVSVMGGLDPDVFTSPILTDSLFGQGGFETGYEDQPLFPEAALLTHPTKQNTEVDAGDDQTQQQQQPTHVDPQTMTINPNQPLIDMDQLYTMSPSTPALDLTSASPVGVRTTKPLPRRTSGGRPVATGTRKNVTPETLVPIDAPTQPRKYFGPSSTSRKDLPATFARKRARSAAVGDDELDDEEDAVAALPPNHTEQQLIEAKRRQNTVAARRSRKRKLEYQRDLEERVEDMSKEIEWLRQRAATSEAMLRSHGLEVPHIPMPH